MIQKNIRPFPFSLLVLAAALGACAGTDGGDDAGRTQGVGTGDVQGQVLKANEEKIARIVRFDQSALQTEGKAKWWIENLTGKDQEDLVWSASFAFPPGQLGQEIQMAEQLETTSERSLVLFKNDKEKMIEAVSPNFTADKRGKVKGVQLNLAIEPPAATIPRGADGTPGTRFFGGRVECVAMSGEDEMNASPPRLWIELENVSDKKVSDLEVQVVFTDTNQRTKWKSLPALAPRARGRADIDLSGIDMGGKFFLVKVRQQAL